MSVPGTGDWGSIREGQTPRIAFFQPIHNVCYLFTCRAFVVLSLSGMLYLAAQSGIPRQSVGLGSWLWFLLFRSVFCLSARFLAAFGMGYLVFQLFGFILEQKFLISYGLFCSGPERERTDVFPQILALEGLLHFYLASCLSVGFGDSSYLGACFRFGIFLE